MGEADRELRELQEELSRLKALVLTPGFKYFMEVLATQVENRKQQIILTPLKKMDEVLEQEYQKGEVAGIALSMNFVEIRVKNIEDEILEILKETQDAGTNRDDSPSDDESGYDDLDASGN